VETTRTDSNQLDDQLIAGINSSAGVIQQELSTQPMRSSSAAPTN